MNLHWSSPDWCIFDGVASLVAIADSSVVAGWWTSWFEPTTSVLVAVTLVLLCTVAWAANLIALPGNWITVALLTIYAWLGPQDSRVAIGYAAVLIAFACALARRDARIPCQCRGGPTGWSKPKIDDLCDRRIDGWGDRWCDRRCSGSRHWLGFGSDFVRWSRGDGRRDVRGMDRWTARGGKAGRLGMLLFGAERSEPSASSTAGLGDRVDCHPERRFLIATRVRLTRDDPFF